MQIINKVTILVLCFLNLHTAYAYEGSQYQYQTPTSIFNITPSLQYSLRTAQYTSGNITGSDTSSFSPTVKAEYGINDIFSVGATLTYTSLKQKSKPAGIESDSTAKGLNDPMLFFNGRTTFGPGSFRFGGRLTFSLEDHTIDSSGTSNFYTGGTAFIPYLGYESTWGAHTFGARIAYPLYKGEQKNRNETSTPVYKTKSKGGEILETSLFWEYAMEPAILGLSFELFNKGRSSYTTTDGTTWDNHDPESHYKIGAYVPTKVADSITLLPQLKYFSVGAFDTSNLKSFTGWEIELGARMDF